MYQEGTSSLNTTCIHCLILEWQNCYMNSKKAQKLLSLLLKRITINLTLKIKYFKKTHANKSYCACTELSDYCLPYIPLIC